jgi:hypothetical protein
MMPDDLRKRATHYRSMATRLTDTRAIAALYELAEKYEALADADRNPPGRPEGRAERRSGPDHDPVGREPCPRKDS